MVCKSAAPLSAQRLTDVVDDWLGVAHAQVTFEHKAVLQPELDIFRTWYNQLGTHENIDGLTPKEAWLRKRDGYPDKAVLATDWDGMLMSYYFPH